MKSDSYGRGESIFLPTTQAEYYGNLLVGQKFPALQESAALSKHFGILRGRKAEWQRAQAPGSDRSALTPSSVLPSHMSLGKLLNVYFQFLISKTGIIIPTSYSSCDSYM